MTEFEKLGGTYHRRHLKEHHRVRYYNLLTTGMLNDYLAEVESRAQAMFDTLVKELSEKENLNEKLKASDPLEWVRRSNNIRNRATEIVNAEVIFV